MDEIKNLNEMPDDQIRKIKMIVFDVDGVIIPKGSNLHESSDGTELSMKTHKLSDEFIKNIFELKKHVRIAFSSGRNLLYLRTLVKDFFDNSIILQTENGALTFMDGKLVHEDFPDEYFESLYKIRNEITANSEKTHLMGFEPKIFNLAAHTIVERPLVQEIAKRNDPKGIIYCIWTGEAYDVGLKGVSKGSALEKLTKKLGFARDEVITTGNALNDKEMLEYGVGVTVEPTIVWGQYKTSGNGLGGEELARFLVERKNSLNR